MPAYIRAARSTPADPVHVTREGDVTRTAWPTTFQFNLHAVFATAINGWSKCRRREVPAGRHDVPNGEQSS